MKFFIKNIIVLLILNMNGLCLKAQTIRINEILVSNQGSITNLYDEDGDSPDYIELYNSGGTTNISGWILMDGDDIWQFPTNTIIPSGGYLTIWASGKDKASSPLHTNFSLDSDGEYLGLYDPSFNLIHEFGTSYPPQTPNISYGYTSSGMLSYFSNITQNTVNTNPIQGKVQTPTADVGRGFYNTTITETLSCATSGAIIRYTTDGSVPTTSSSVYNSPITVNPDATGIFTIRAKAFLAGYAASEEISWSYIFPDALYSGNAAAGLRSLPAVSVQTDDQTYPQGDDILNIPFEKERTNIEMVELDTLKSGFSVTAGVGKFGERSTTYEKSSLRLFFDGEWGVSNLEYPVFDGYEQGFVEPATSFDKLELRGMSWDGFQTPGSTVDYQYIIDRWKKDTRLDMGEPFVHGRYVNLFVNGDYRGVYHLRERLDHQWGASYSKLDEPAEDFEAFKIDYNPNSDDTGIPNLQNGNGSLFNYLSQNNYQSVKNRINTKALIHHTMLMSLMKISPEKEYRGVGSINDYIFMHSDNDWAFSTWATGYQPGYFPGEIPLFESYRNDPEFLQDVYEETAKQFCGTGALTITQMMDRLAYWKNEIALSLYSESVRWQSYVTDPSIPNTPTGIYDRWLINMASIESRMVSETPNLYTQWTTQGLYQGCDLRPQVNLENQVDAVNLPVSYTVDAIDPDGDAMTFTSSTLPPGLSINSSTGEITGTPTQTGIFTVSIRVEDTNNKWGNHTFTWEIINYAPAINDIIINEIMYHPDSLCLAAPTDPDLMSFIEIKNNGTQSVDMTGCKFTDGIDFEFPVGTNIAAGDFFVIAENKYAFEIAYGFAPDGQYKDGLSNDGERLELTDPIGNILDSLTYNDVNPWDEDPDGNGPSLELLDPASDNSDPINWFRSDNSCGTPGAENSRICTSTADAIVINEINYNSNNGVTDPGDWVELHNPSANAIDISDWTFYDNNNEFIFPSGTSIGAGEFLVLVESATMFTSIFPHLNANQYIGDFTFGLSNKGERVSLFDENKCLSDYVVYNDRIPWDTIPDGNGPTLSLITPNSDNTLPQSWEASSNINSAYGTPGRANEPCLESVLILPNLICAGFPVEIKTDSAYNNMDYTWFVSGATPSNFTVDSTTVIWNNPGTYNIQLITKHFECTKVYTQQVTVEDCNTIPNIIDDNFSINEDNVLSDNVLINDNDPDNDNLIVNTIPQINVSNGTLTLNADGTFDYTPNPDFYGTDSFTYEVCDDATFGSTTTTPGSFTGEVTSGADDVEELSTDGSIDITSSDLDLTEDSPDVYSAIGIRITNITVPQGATVTNAYLEFVADEVQSVATSLTISAEATGNAAAIPTTNYALTSKTKTNANTSWANLPAWTIGDTYQSADISSVVQELINRGDWASGNAMTFIIEGTGTRTAESFNGTAAPKLVIDYEIVSNDGQVDISLCDVAEVTINVAPENDAPQAVDDNTTTTEEVAKTGNVLSNDNDVDGDNLTINITPITPPQNGSFFLLASGSYSYTPNVNFYGTDGFEYEICDNGSPLMCDTASVTIDVTPVNDTPMPMPDTLSMFANSSIQHNVLLNDFDIENDNLTAMVSPIAAPINGTVTIQPNGNIDYAPNPNFVGTDSFTYEVCDDGTPSMCNTEIVTVVVEPDCVDIELAAWLEGAFDPALGEMRTALVATRKLLPGQTPASNLATPTPAGQPYSIAPWSYAGTEGAGWTDGDYTGDETDWVLVSFRTDIQKSTQVGITAGLLMKDGSIYFPNRCALTSAVASPLYIVIEHRNHIGVMTPQPVDVIGSTLTYDFRLSDSYRDQTSFGQKQIPTGEWTMFAGDADQSDFPSFDIKGTDKTIWFDNNGIFDYYFSPDFNLDGDINGQDKTLWFENNGISSRVPK